MSKFLMACPPVIEGKLIPIEPKPPKTSKTKRATKWLALQAELIADEIKMAIYRGKRKTKAELINGLTLARFIQPAIKTAAVVIIGDCLNYALQAVA